MCSKANSPLRTTARRCVSPAGGVCLRRALSPAAQLQYCNIILVNMQSVCMHPSALMCFCPVFSSVLWCVFDITHVHWVQHRYCCNAVPSFSKHTYDIPLREALIFCHLCGQEHSVLCIKTLYILNTAVTALVGCDEKLNRAVNRLNSQ